MLTAPLTAPTEKPIPISDEQAKQLSLFTIEEQVGVKELKDFIDTGKECLAAYRKHKDSNADYTFCYMLNGEEDTDKKEINQLAFYSDSKEKIAIMLKVIEHIDRLTIADVDIMLGIATPNIEYIAKEAHAWRLNIEKVLSIKYSKKEQAYIEDAYINGCVNVLTRNMPKKKNPIPDGK